MKGWFKSLDEIEKFKKYVFTRLVIRDIRLRQIKFNVKFMTLLQYILNSTQYL